MSARRLWVVEWDNGHRWVPLWHDCHEYPVPDRMVPEPDHQCTRYVPALTPEREEEIVEEIVSRALGARDAYDRVAFFEIEHAARHALKLAQGGER